jgi:HEAT repeat protein
MGFHRLPLLFIAVTVMAVTVLGLYQTDALTGMSEWMGNPHDGRPASWWLGRLRSPDASVRIDALYGLEAHAADPAVLPVLVETLASDRDEGVRVASVQPLSKAGPAAAVALRRALDDPNRRLRLHVVHALGRLQPCEAASVTALAGIVEKEPDDYIRLIAVRMLARMGPEALTAVPVLRRTLEHDHRIPRDTVASAIREIEETRPQFDRSGVPLASVTR